MKKIISSIIIISVFTFVIGAGFLIVKIGLESQTSTPHIILAFFDGMAAPNATLVRLADAESEIAPVEHQAIMAANYIPRMPVPAVQSGAPTTKNPALAPITIQQSLEVAAAELIHEQMLTEQKLQEKP